MPSRVATRVPVFKSLVWWPDQIRKEGEWGVGGSAGSLCLLLLRWIPYHLATQAVSLTCKWVTIAQSVVCGLAVLHDAASQIWFSAEHPVEGIFPLVLTWVLTPFPKNSFEWQNKLRSSLWAHAFHGTNSKDPDVHVLDSWMPATKHIQHAPSMKMECGYLYGWIIECSHVQHLTKNGKPQRQLGTKKKKNMQMSWTPKHVNTLCVPLTSAYSCKHVTYNKHVCAKAMNSFTLSNMSTSMC